MKALFENFIDKYAVCGFPISHSQSPEIYNYWMRYSIPESFYTRISAKNLEEIQIIDKILNLKGINLTSPLKNIYQLDISINTVVKRDNETNYFNTDNEYFDNLIDIIDFKNKSILIIGGGESAKNIGRSLEKLNLNFSYILRNPDLKDIYNYFNKKLLNIININDLICNFDIIINTIKFTDEYLNKTIKFENKIIIDLIYQNEIFKNRMINCEYYSGFDWLIGQAKKSFSYYFPDLEIEEFDLEQLNTKKHKLISLIGFMGSGKTTLGKLLAEKLSYYFVDTDDLIRKKYGEIRDIFIDYGEDRFREMEYEALNSIDLSNNTIISTGGGILRSWESCEFLEQNTFRIWLLNSSKNVYRRIIGTDRPLLTNYKHFYELFNYRKDIYFSNSDLIIYNDDIDDCSERLIEEIRNYAD